MVSSANARMAAISRKKLTPDERWPVTSNALVTLFLLTFHENRTYTPIRIEFRWKCSGARFGGRNRGGDMQQRRRFRVSVFVVPLATVSQLFVLGVKLEAQLARFPGPISSQTSRAKRE